MPHDDVSPGWSCIPVDVIDVHNTTAVVQVGNDLLRYLITGEWTAEPKEPATSNVNTELCKQANDTWKLLMQSAQPGSHPLDSLTDFASLMAGSVVYKKQ